MSAYLCPSGPASIVLMTLALAACGDAGETDTSAEMILSTTLENGARLRGGATFRVTVDGKGILSASFGPREVSRFVSPPDPTAEFSTDEFPEGRGFLRFTIQNGWDRVAFADMVFDRTAPTVQFLSPMDGAEVAGTFDVAVRAHDNLGVASIEVQAAGSPVAVIPAAEGVVTIDAAGYPAGNLVLAATPTDMVGNVGAPAQLTVTVR